MEGLPGKQIIDDGAQSKPQPDAIRQQMKILQIGAVVRLIVHQRMDRRRLIEHGRDDLFETFGA
jgi:limonene-1,2-epoxide hydrolase